MQRFLEHSVLWLLEAVLAAWPHRRPRRDQLARAMIIAHRGERDDVHVKENTLAAFDRAVAAGVGAIEFDVRYTADHEPVVLHDADLARVFGLPERVDCLSWAALQARAPELPHLAELIERYGARVHLMIEIKTRGSVRAECRMRDQLARLMPGRDYHVLALDPTLFDAVADLPAVALVPVAKSNWRAVRAWSRAHACGGIAGPYPLIRRADILDSQRAGRRIGSGFISRRGLLLREIGRGIPWIFTNRPVALQAMLEQLRHQSGAASSAGK